MLQDRLNPDAALQQQCEEGRQTAAILDEATTLWHQHEPLASSIVLELHAANFELWHLEDRARDPLSEDAVIAGVKRAIDRVNQRRNDTVEQIDLALLHSLAAANLPRVSAPLHSETPGQMLDRLSILSLKLFHTEIETVRESATAEHRARNVERLLALREQQGDLADCLSELMQQVILGERRFKLYRQHKMYNDPALNPVLYQKS